MNYDLIFDKDEIIIEEKKTGRDKSITIYKPKYEKGKIFAPLQNKYLEAKPEEKVRQEFICRLINDYGYTLEQMAQEVQLTSSSRGTGRASADIVIWRTKEEREQNKTAFLVVELKAEALKLKPEDFYQGYNYATWSRAKLFVISNGKIVKIYKTIEEELPLSLQPVSEIPHAKDVLDNQKLEDILSQTKEFTGDEFAKLLHKCHNIIRNNDKLSPEASFDEISKILFLKIMYEREPDDDTLIFSKQKVKKEMEIHKKKIERGATNISFLEEQFNSVKFAFRNDGIFEENEKIKIRENSFIDIISELEIYNLTATSEDVKGIAFETFLGRTFRGELGQFFTPRVIVNFMVELLNPQEKELICDPCAGSGGFLIKAFESVKTTIDNKYIEIKKAKYKEIFQEGKKLTANEEAKKVQEYEKYLEEINKKQDEQIEYLSKKSIFGTDANPRMARVSKMNMIMHGDGHNGIHHNDGLLNVNGIFRGRFDVIFTNPPFGTTLSQTSPTVELDDKYTNIEKIEFYKSLYPHYEEEMEQVTKNFGKPIRGLFEVGKSAGQTEVLFIERCLDLLRDGGRMGIVLPEGVLNSSNLQFAREFFESRAKILLIVSLPQEIFISSGATVKTSLVFLKKFTTEEKAQYESIKEEAIKEITAKYQKELDEIEKKLAIKGKEALKKDEKKELQQRQTELNNLISTEVKEQIKQKFDYEIPIADIKKAGINSTGGKEENQLPELLKAFVEYRTTNNLWEVVK
jgi:type I restriction enzyme M protein